MDDRTQLVDARELIARSRRFDLIFKVELAWAWVYGTPQEIRTAEEAYLEMVRARNGFRESDPPRSGPKAFIEAFRKTASSILENGYDLTLSPVPLDSEGEVLNGAHRLAACAAYEKKCLVRFLDSRSSGGSEIRAFTDGCISPAVMSWGMRAYLRRFPEGRHAADYGMASNGEPEFPDWDSHAKSLRVHSFLWRLRGYVYAIKAMFKSGNAKARSLKHADECRHRADAPTRLAKYWNERGCVG